jgi:preprotein translocase subunit YajC
MWWIQAGAMHLAQAVSEGGGQAPANQQGQGPGGFGYEPLILIAAMVAIMYFFMFRPQAKREKERKEMLGALKKGDRVMTNGGIFGTIVGLNDQTAVLRIDDDVTVEFLRAAIARVVTSKEGGEEEAEDKDN